MKYIKWFILSVLDVAFNIIAYLTNPIILLFADEVGNLPSWALWWANWDDHLDIDWMIYEHNVPSWAEYDFNKHYKYHSPHEAEKTTGKHYGYVDLLDPNFTTKERIQRYFCRLTWIYRNCGYGFSYYVTGKTINGTDIIKVRNFPNEEGNRDQYYYTDDAFMIRYEKIWCKWFWLRIFLGWKMQSVKTTETKRCMLALFIHPFRLVKSL